jgi:Heparinase II/III-like protein/Heparinase II/III N-terminus
LSPSSARLGWYLRRLQAMSPAEITLHLRRAAGYRWQAVAWNVARPLWRRAWEPPIDRLVARDEIPPSALFLSSGRVESVRGVLGDRSTHIVMEAERRMDGRVVLFGHPEVILGPERRFDCDPLSGMPWPDRHGRLIDYRLASPGDPKLVWEVERCQELPLLALASLLSGELRFADAAASRLCAWLASHRPGRGIAWANAFEPAMRAISLAIAFDALRGHELLSGEVGHAMARRLWQHGRWIIHDRSRYSSANNHLLAELAGLLAIAVLVPELRDSRRWLELALDELSREAQLQILPDGSGAEQSFAYGLFTVDLLLTCAALLDTAARPCPEPIVSALARAADALALLVDVEEPDPAFGDDDDARVLVLDGSYDRSACGVATSLAAFLGHAGARRLAGSVDANAALLFGLQGVARFESAATVGQSGDGVLPDGGLVVLRRSGTRVLFDVGSLGYLSIAAHGHADALQVLVSHGADELVTDPGTGSYLGDATLRGRLRGTAAHATVTVDGLDQSQQAGPFLWSRHAPARLLVCDLDAGIAIGEHDGYESLPDPVSHRRAIVALQGGALLVLDELVATGEHMYVQAWPLHPALEPHEQDVDSGIVVASNPHHSGIVLVLKSSVPSQVALNSDARWSRHLGTSQPTTAVTQCVSARGPVLLAALLVPTAEKRLTHAALSLQGERGSHVASVSVGHFHDRIRVEFTTEPPTVHRLAR